MSEANYEEDLNLDDNIATYGLTEQAMNLDRPQARYAGDENLFVKFFLHPCQNNKKTAREGRPIFDEREYVEIRIPGDKDNAVIRPVRDMDKTRFASRYQQFASGLAQTQSGTPLEQWPGVTRAQVEEMKFFDIFTVEQLAEMPDSAAQRFMGGQQLKGAAKSYLDQAQGLSVSTQLQEQLDEKENQIAALQAAVEEQARQIAHLQEEE